MSENGGLCGNARPKSPHLSRFANSRQLMAHLGLVPSEHSSGASVKRGGLTKLDDNRLLMGATNNRVS